MKNKFAVLATVVAVGGAALMAPIPARAGDIAPGPGVLAVGALALAPDIYDGYVYGPLPYGPYYSGRISYRSRVYHSGRVHRGSRIHYVGRVHHVARAYRLFDPYYGGGPFYHRHYCCRYW